VHEKYGIGEDKANKLAMSLRKPMLMKEVMQMLRKQEEPIQTYKPAIKILESNGKQCSSLPDYWDNDLFGDLI
jgi:hypothetical protein